MNLPAGPACAREKGTDQREVRPHGSQRYGGRLVLAVVAALLLALLGRGRRALLLALLAGHLPGVILALLLELLVVGLRLVILVFVLILVLVVLVLVLLALALSLALALALGVGALVLLLGRLRALAAAVGRELDDGAGGALLGGCSNGGEAPVSSRVSCQGQQFGGVGFLCGHVDFCPGRGRHARRGPEGASK